MFNVRLAGGYLYGKQLCTWLSLVVSLMASFVLSFFPLDLGRNRPFSHCLCACVYRSRGALFLDNRRDFTQMGQTDFKPLILSM